MVPFDYAKRPKSSLILIMHSYTEFKQSMLVLVQEGCAELTRVITPAILSFALRANFQLFKFVPDKFVSTADDEIKPQVSLKQ